MAKAKAKSKSSKVKSALKGADLQGVLKDAEKGQKDSALVELDIDSLSTSMPHISSGSISLDNRVSNIGPNLGVSAIILLASCRKAALTPA